MKLILKLQTVSQGLSWAVYTALFLTVTSKIACSMDLAFDVNFLDRSL